MHDPLDNFTLIGGILEFLASKAGIIILLTICVAGVLFGIVNIIVSIYHS